MTLTENTQSLKKPLLFIHPLLKQKRYISSLILLSPTSKIVHRLIYITCVWNTTLLFYSSNLKKKNWIFHSKEFCSFVEVDYYCNYWWWYFCYTIWRKRIFENWSLQCCQLFLQMKILNIQKGIITKWNDPLIKNFEKFWWREWAKKNWTREKDKKITTY